MGSDKNNDLLGQTIDTIFAKSSPGKQVISNSKAGLGGISAQELQVALTVVLVDLASCDQNFEPREYQIISAGLKQMFGTSKEEVKALVNQATLVLSNLRGTNHFAKMLRDNLDEEQKIAVMEIIDTIIHVDGQEDGFETYLRNKFARLLGIPTDVPVSEAAN